MRIRLLTRAEDRLLLMYRAGDVPNLMLAVRELLRRQQDAAAPSKKAGDTLAPKGGQE